MKTEDLIRAVVADNTSMEPPVSQTLPVWLLGGTAVAAVGFAALLGIRPDFMWSIQHDIRFAFKFLVTLSLLVPALYLALQVSRPDFKLGNHVWLLALAPLLLAISVVVEMTVVPMDHWTVYAKGSMALACSVLIPSLSLAPLMAILIALRRGAPANPMLAGAVGGLVSAGIGATMYAAHCVDDSPLFVGIWYPLATLLVTAAGALLGKYVLRW